MDVYVNIVWQKPGPGVCKYSSGSSPVRIVLVGPAEAGQDVYCTSPGEAGRSGSGSSPERDLIYGCNPGVIGSDVPWLECPACNALTWVITVTE